jgi:NAD(P)-dependent dehydrogenase (short-subunit alcohol dehydrogenase family)
MDLSGKTALITGATSGIGRAAAIALADARAHALVAGRDETRGHEVVDAISQSGGTAEFIQTSFHDAQSAQTLAHLATNITGRVDILVNCAGTAIFGPTASVSEQEFDQLFAVNVKAPFFLVAALAPAMAANGGGAIVNVTTMVAGFGMPGQAPYGASKAALALLTKSWAAEFGPAGVRVNAVSPGPTRTLGTAPMGDQLDQIASTAPLGRVANPDEIAQAILFLASDNASFVDGVILSADGGRAAI